MPKIRITVLKKTINAELAEEYCVGDIKKCPVFEEGDVFETGLEKPEKFCLWAWNDIFKYMTVFLAEGSFAKGVFEGWMKDSRQMITCCTDGIRPVIFKIELI